MSQIRDRRPETPDVSDPKQRRHRRRAQTHAGDSSFGQQIER
jgi:hypothetical protein